MDEWINGEGEKEREKQIQAIDNTHVPLAVFPTYKSTPIRRTYLLGVNWRQWRLKLKLSLSQKVGCTVEVVTQSRTTVHPATMALQIKTLTIPKGGLHGRSLSPNLGRQWIWAELVLHETWRTFCHLGSSSKSAGTLSCNPTQTPFVVMRTSH